MVNCKVVASLVVFFVPLEPLLFLRFSRDAGIGTGSATGAGSRAAMAPTAGSAIGFAIARVERMRMGRVVKDFIVA